MELELIVIIGFITTVLTILVKIVGFPDQIKKNYQRKSTEGISTAFYVLSFITYIFWTIHGILQNDWVVYFGQGLGILTTGIIVFQIFFYHKK
ncbi:MAG: PQ-loop repeat-containing protein [Candidatus Nomurabacteria bacterium]|nr:PQ-loop repeat-containing protein [Candidatus Nomurabacteria bacterium]